MLGKTFSPKCGEDVALLKLAKFCNSFLGISKSLKVLDSVARTSPHPRIISQCPNFT